MLRIHFDLKWIFFFFTMFKNLKELPRIIKGLFEFSLFKNFRHEWWATRNATIQRNTTSTSCTSSARSRWRRRICAVASASFPNFTRNCVACSRWYHICCPVCRKAAIWEEAPLKWWPRRDAANWTSSCWRCLAWPKRFATVIWSTRSFIRCCVIKKRRLTSTSPSGGTSRLI